MKFLRPPFCVLSLILTQALTPCFAQAALSQETSFRFLHIEDVSELAAQAAKSLRTCKVHNWTVSEDNLLNKTSEHLDKKVLATAIQVELSKAKVSTNEGTPAQVSAVISSSSSENAQSYHVVYVLKLKISGAGESTPCEAESHVTKESNFK